jgi:hypothetical protein
MATLSVKQIGKNCLGLPSQFSVNSDLYGYRFRANDGSVFGTLNGDKLPGSGQPTTRSLKKHLQTITDKSVDLALILVGHEEDFSGAVSRDDVTKIQYAVQIARDLYAQAPLGIRRLDWRRIPLADAGGHVNILDGGEATDLTDDWSASGVSVDVFWVQSIGDAGGWSNTDGPCDKDEKYERTGAVIQLGSSRRFTGILLGHEVGHYLGLAHGSSKSNMMGVDDDNDGIGDTDDNSTNITSGQGTKMREHCFVKPAC